MNEDDAEEENDVKDEDEDALVVASTASSGMLALGVKYLGVDDRVTRNVASLACRPSCEKAIEWPEMRKASKLNQTRDDEKSQ